MDESSSRPSLQSKVNPDGLNVEEKLKASEERYHSLFSNMTDGFAFCKMIFNEENQFYQKSKKLIPNCSRLLEELL